MTPALARELAEVFAADAFMHPDALESARLDAIASDLRDKAERLSRDSVSEILASIAQDVEAA